MGENGGMRPMLASKGTFVPRGEEWVHEVKWDGVRAIAYVKPGRLRLESRNLNEITETYPEVRAILRDLGMREAVFDGEIVAFGDDGRPSFERLQRRINVSSASAVRRLVSSTPVVYAIFDLLYLDEPAPGVTPEPDGDPLVLVFCTGCPLPDVDGARVVLSDDRALAARYGLGAPGRTGYALVDARGQVRYRTYDPRPGQHGTEIQTLVDGMPR